MANAAQVGARHLWALCVAHLGLTPTQLIRNVRLHQARTELLIALPGQVRVADIAARVGYPGRSRFTAHYRDRYGELPSTTMRRAPSTNPTTSVLSLSQFIAEPAPAPMGAT
ncbi:helix-turn-helix domain-containing protein [Actinomadura sp. NPDC023710]|uniref:helix-turn-helix domain-containing protein n=1 Tax=Actinomadura sp. NPDC023710 TaxID=3158219 RepID=UPI003411C820